jgi:hypothetical protein
VDSKILQWLTVGSIFTSLVLTLAVYIIERRLSRLLVELHKESEKIGNMGGDQTGTSFVGQSERNPSVEDR